jgi:hypothetical protein
MRTFWQVQLQAMQREAQSQLHPVSPKLPQPLEEFSLALALAVLRRVDLWKCQAPMLQNLET